jgi:hypothetical protein
MSTEKSKEDKKIKPFEQPAYKLSPALKRAVERAKKEQPELIAISGKLRYVHLD